MKQDSPSVRIFCVDHREAEVPLPPGVTVIGVGKNRRTGILHDNEGENIAHLNAHLNEATALVGVATPRGPPNGLCGLLPLPQVPILPPHAGPSRHRCLAVGAMPSPCLACGVRGALPVRRT